MFFVDNGASVSSPTPGATCRMQSAKCRVVELRGLCESRRRLSVCIRSGSIVDFDGGGWGVLDEDREVVQEILADVRVPPSEATRGENFFVFCSRGVR